MTHLTAVPPYPVCGSDAAGNGRGALQLAIRELLNRRIGNELAHSATEGIQQEMAHI